MKRLLAILIMISLCISTPAFTPSADAATNEFFIQEMELWVKATCSATRTETQDYAKEFEDYTETDNYNETEHFNVTIEGTTQLTAMSGYPTNSPVPIESWPLMISTEDNKISVNGGGNLTYAGYRQGQKSDPDTGEIVYFPVNFNDNGSWTYSSKSEIYEDPVISGSVFIYPPTSGSSEKPRYEFELGQVFFGDMEALDKYAAVAGTISRTTTGDDGTETVTEQVTHRQVTDIPDNAILEWNHLPEEGLLKGELTFDGTEYHGKGQVSYPYTYRLDSPEQGLTIQENGNLNICWEINPKPGVKAIQPNQVLGRYAYRSDDDYDPATDFVSGKDTVVQVFLHDELNVDEVNNLELDIYRDGSKVTTLTNPKKDKPNNAFIFIPHDKSQCGDWAEGTYRFVARLGDVDKTLDGVSFKPRREFRILAVPVRANYGGTIKEPGNFADADLFLRKVFPLSDENVKFVIGPMQDLSDSRYDLNTEDGRKWAWLKIRDLQPDKYVSPQYDAIVGFVAEPILLYETDQYQVYVQGFTVRKPAALVALDSGYQTTLAHEIAHYFNIGDEYNGGSFNLSVNPPPLGYTGTDWDTNAAVTSQASDVKPAAAGSGSLISSKLHPFEFGKRKLLGDEISFMGSGATSEFWISPAIWKHLYNTLAPQSTAQAAAVNTERVIVAAGLISNTGVEPLVPWFSYIPNVPVATATGTHSIRAVDETGSTLATQGFTPYFTQLTNPPMTSDKGVFEVTVPLPAGTRAYQIFAGETLLGEIPVSPEAPVISITSPSAGETLSGEATIEWTASDADSSELYYRVEYSPDGNQWLVLQPATLSTQYTADFATLPGGSQALIRVTATDGINSATATSPAFEVPLKAPEIFIQSPTDGESVSLLEGLFLQGRAYDPQEQWIYDPTQLVWTSDKDGELGRGPAIFLDNLSAGTHVITLQATNSVGMSSAKSVTVTAESDGTPPVDECFIATAAFGSKLEPAVVLLRQFRDRFLLSNGPGRAFVDFYYRTSPPIAAFIAGSEPLQALVRVLLIPVIVMAYSIMQPIAGIGFIFILIFILVLKVRHPRVLAK